LENIKLKKNQLSELIKFKESKLFSDQTVTSDSKSDYWKYNASLMKVDIFEGGNVKISGASGFYIPAYKKNVFQYLVKAIASPSKVLSYLRRSLLNLALDSPVYIRPKKAFDMVMNHHDASEPVLSPFRLNHIKMHADHGVLKASNDVLNDFKKWSDRPPNDHIYYGYYFFNILNSFGAIRNTSKVLEIGGGTGNLASILFKKSKNIQMILVDLPETIINACIYLSSIFPDQKILLPNQLEQMKKIDSQELEGYDFIFATPSQLELIPNDYCDLAINTHSFQEMLPSQIKKYIDFIQRVTKNKGYFFCVNRVEKISAGPDAYMELQYDPPVRIYEYPWKSENITLVNEISRFHRLTQADNVVIRLDEIKK
jgi:putative sugar O-methyltransferase